MLLEPSLGSFVVLDVFHSSAKLKIDEPMFAKRPPAYKAEITKIDKRSNPISSWYCILDDCLTKLPLRPNFAAVSPTCINILLASWCIA